MNCYISDGSSVEEKNTTKSIKRTFTVFVNQVYYKWISHSSRHYTRWLIQQLKHNILLTAVKIHSNREGMNINKNPHQNFTTYQRSGQCTVKKEWNKRAWNLKVKCKGHKLTFCINVHEIENAFWLLRTPNVNSDIPTVKLVHFAFHFSRMFRIIYCTFAIHYQESNSDSQSENCLGHSREKRKVRDFKNIERANWKYIWSHTRNLNINLYPHYRINLWRAEV